MTFKDVWKRVNPLSRVIFVLLIIYVIIGIFYLCISMEIVNFNHYLSDHPLKLEYISAGFAIISFVFIVFISAFHLSTLIRRRKRHADKIADGKIKAQ